MNIQTDFETFTTEATNERGEVIATTAGVIALPFAATVKSYTMIASTDDWSEEIDIIVRTDLAEQPRRLAQQVGEQQLADSYDPEFVSDCEIEMTVAGSRWTVYTV